jgi:DNA-dependent protein kinase catalytic subunit
VHALTALRKKQSLLTDTCEIFVKEPLLDWLKDAQKRNKSTRTASQALSSVEESNASSSMFSLERQHDADEQLSWYPRKKIETFKKKLLGVNPVKILYRELKDSTHAQKDYMECLGKAIQGPDGCIRHYHLTANRVRYLEPED